MRCNATQIEGRQGVRTTADGYIEGGGGGFTPFRFINIPTANTASQIFVDLMVVPDVVVTTQGDIVLDFFGSIQAAYTGALAGPLGGLFQFLWDGLARPEQAFFVVDPAFAAPNLDSIAGNPRLFAVIPSALATVGTHDVRVQWATADALEQIDSFADNGGLVIRGAN